MLRNFFNAPYILLRLTFSDAPNSQLTLNYFGDASSNLIRRRISRIFWSLNRVRVILLSHL